MTLESRLKTTKYFKRWELGTLLDILETWNTQSLS